MPPSLMESALARQRAEVAASQPTGPATAAPATGPATMAIPAGKTGVGLDAFAAARAEALGKLQQMQANQRSLLAQLGEQGYIDAFNEARAKAAAADAQYRQAAAAHGVSNFVG